MTAQTDEGTQAAGAPVERPVRPLYAERDHAAQGAYYMRHVDAMTREGLHAKSAIAGELAHRDMEIASAQMELESLQDSYGQLMAENVRLRARILELKAVHEDASGAVLQERERCAKLCDTIAADTRDDHWDAVTAEECASRIRGIRADA